MKKVTKANGKKMNLLEFADVIDKQIEIIYYPNQDCRFSASFRDCEIMEDGMLIYTFGDGKTPEEAMNDYAKIISKKRIAFDALSREYRKEFEVPKLNEGTL